MAYSPCRKAGICTLRPRGRAKTRCLPCAMKGREFRRTSVTKSLICISLLKRAGAGLDSRYRTEYCSCITVLSNLIPLKAMALFFLCAFHLRKLTYWKSRRERPRKIRSGLHETNSPPSRDVCAVRFAPAHRLQQEEE